jgi:hypothetical protein
MKKLIPILTAMGLVLAVGLAYADDMRSIVQDDGVTYAALDNGVTFVGQVDTGIQCFGAAAGGMVESKDIRSIVQDDGFRYIAPDNSVTFAAESLGPKCSWARGLGRELKLIMHNGVTVPGGTE